VDKCECIDRRVEIIISCVLFIHNCDGVGHMHANILIRVWMWFGNTKISYDHFHI
jgi:hypothetical protein